MFTAVLSFLSGIFGPITTLIDKTTTTEQEKLELRNAFAQIQSDLYTKMVELEGKRMELQAEIQKAESGSNYWLVANWRPATSVILVASILISAFMSKPLPDQIMQLAEIFLGLHAGGRSIEKIVKNIKLGK